MLNKHPDTLKKGTRNIVCVSDSEMTSTHHSIQAT